VHREATGVGSQIVAAGVGCMALQIASITGRVVNTGRPRARTHGRSSPDGAR
jgi:hypothetical protein